MGSSYGTSFPTGGINPGHHHKDTLTGKTYEYQGENVLDLSNNWKEVITAQRDETSPGSDILTRAGTWEAQIGVASDTVEQNAFGDSSTAGVSGSYSRGDHKHGMPDNPVTAHVAALDPHTQYALDSEKGAASGIATLSVNSKVEQDQARIVLRDEKTAGTNGGSSAATTWNVRTLNTVVSNSIPGASLASNQVTLPAGTYRINARAPAYKVDAHKLRLRNITDGSTAVVGSASNCGSGVTTQSDVFITDAIFTIAGTKVFELQHYTQTATATVGLGNNSGGGEVEVYAEISIVKI